MRSLRSLTNELNECGYPGDKIAETLREVFQPQIEPFNLQTNMQMNDGDTLMLDFEFYFYPSGDTELRGVNAAFASQYAQMQTWRYFPDLPTIEAVENALKGPQTVQDNIIYHSFNHSIAMNLNNLQDLKGEVKDLGFSPKVADELEPNMRTQTPYFTLKEQLPGDNGLPVDMTLHFRKSNESQFYSFNKFEAVAGKIPPAVENQQYMVLTENKEHPERPLVKEFPSGHEAVEFFKKQKGTSELAIGESAESKQILASKENGTLNYVSNDFKNAYYGAAIKQTFYVSRGAGFTAGQAANMVQHRTVHRDNMLNPNTGEAYKAWIGLDFDQAKDNYGNYKLKQMNAPNFGFNLEKTLENFKIKELADPAKKEEIVAAMRNGDRIPVTIIGKDNKEHQVQVEAVPRYKTMDFFNRDGEKMRREPFLKPIINQDLGKDKGKGKGKDNGEDLGVAV